MRRGTVVAALAAALVSVAAVPAHAQAGARTPTLTMSGSSTMLPLVADLTYYFRREVQRPPRIVLRGGGSQTGADDALRGIVTAGMVSRDKQDDDGAGLVFTPIAYSGICIVTNVANPLAGLSRAQLQGLVSAQLTDWGQVPGAVRPGPITAAALALGTGGRTTFLSVFVDGTTDVAYQPRTFGTAAAMRAHLLATPTAWGYIDFAFAGGLHAVPIDGVPCTRATIASGAYPARRPLHLATRGRPRGAVSRFLTWIRTSPTARRVIATRYVPAGGR